MKINHYAKSIRVALLYGGVCFFVSWGLSVVGWWLFPDQTKDDELMRQLHWSAHMVVEKIVGLFLVCITAFLAGRSYHPTWRWGVVTALAAAVACQLIAVLVYVMRFGVVAYQQYNNFILTIFWTGLLAWFFGYLAVRKQYLHDKHAA